MRLPHTAGQPGQQQLLKENRFDIVQEANQVAKSLEFHRQDVVLELDLKASNNPALPHQTIQRLYNR
jgi:hypothetical protein